MFSKTLVKSFVENHDEAIREGLEELDNGCYTDMSIDELTDEFMVYIRETVTSNIQFDFDIDDLEIFE